PRVVLRYRRHESNLSTKLLWMRQCSHDVHRWYADQMEDRAIVRDVLSQDLFKIGRHLVDEGRVREARAAFVASVRHKPGVRARAWSIVLALPDGVRRRAGDALVRLSRTVAARRSAGAPSPS